jgi:hypothetical protein
VNDRRAGSAPLGRELSDLLRMCGYDDSSIAKILLRAKITQNEPSQANGTRKTLFRRVDSMRMGGGEDGRTTIRHKLTPLEVSPGGQDAPWSPSTERGHHMAPLEPPLPTALPPSPALPSFLTLSRI